MLTYKFKSLNELAAYLEGKAVDIRKYADDPKNKKQHTKEENIRASEMENIARILRNTIIGDEG